MAVLLLSIYSYILSNWPVASGLLILTCLTSEPRRYLSIFVIWVRLPKSLKETTGYEGWARAQTEKKLLGAADCWQWWNPPHAKRSLWAPSCLADEDHQCSITELSNSLLNCSPICKCKTMRYKQLVRSHRVNVGTITSINSFLVLHIVPDIRVPYTRNKYQRFEWTSFYFLF